MLPLHPQPGGLGYRHWLGWVLGLRSDKRVVELYPLPEGLKLLKKIPGPYSGVLPQALSELDAQTLQELERNLQLLLEKMDIDERSAQTPMAMM